MKRIIVATALFSVALVSCSQKGDEPGSGRSAPAKRTTTTTARLGSFSSAAAEVEPVGGVSSGHAAAEEPPPFVARGTALGWVPKDALFAVRVADADGYRQAWEGTALARALRQLDLDALMALADDGFAAIKKDVADGVPGSDLLPEVLREVTGEIVFALTEVDPRASGRGVPFSVTFHAQMAADAPALDGLLQTWAADSTMGEKFKSIGPGRYRVDDEFAPLDVLRHDDWLSIQFGPKGAAASLDDALGRAPLDSFLAADVVRFSSGDVDGEIGWLESYVNLDAVLKLADGFVGRSEREVLQAMRIDRLRGVALKSAFAGDSFHDEIVIHSTGRDDLLTALLSGGRLDIDIAGYVPADMDAASVISFDLHDAFRAVRDRLPASARRELDGGVLDFELQTGFKLEKMVLPAFGPGFAFGSRGSLIGAAIDGEPFDGVLAIQLRDNESAAKLIDAITRGTGIHRMLKPRQAGDVRYLSLALPIPDMSPGFEICFRVFDDSLVVATSATTFEAAISQKDGGTYYAALEKAVAAAGPDTWAVGITNPGRDIADFARAARHGAEEMAAAGVTSGTDPRQWLPTQRSIDRFARELPAGWWAWGRTPNGVRFDNHSAFGGPMLCGVGVAVVAALAIPSLLQSRISANEQAAITTMRSFVSAQGQFQASEFADRDGDGVGEYGSFAELAGVADLPGGGRAAPPVLSPGLGAVDAGMVEKSGYLYRIYLPGKNGEWLAEMSAGGSPSNVDAQRAEREFRAYAWPRDLGSTGNRAFFIDQNGDLYVTQNDGTGAIYSGRDRGPAADAATSRYPSEEMGRPAVMRRGYDGSSWFIVR